MDTHRLSSSQALAWAGRGPWSRGGDDAAAAAGFEGAPALRPEVDADGTDVLVVASVRRPVLGAAMARFADQEVSRAVSPETLRRAPWRAWAAEPVLVVGGRAARAVTALRGAGGGPWILSRARRRPARRDRVVTSERQGALT